MGIGQAAEHFVVLGAAALLLLAAAYSDARRYRIPNLLCVALLGLFPLFVLTASQPVAWERNLVVFGFVLAGGFFLFAKNIIGAGDIKLLASISLWAGPEFVGLFLFITAVTGGLLALVVAGIQYAQKRSRAGLGKLPLPHGIAIALGGLCVLLMLAQATRVSGLG